MDIKKFILFSLFAIIFKTDASQLTPELDKYLDGKTASIVEQYVYDGTLTLNPAYRIDTLGSSYFGLHWSKCDLINRIHDHQYKDQAARTLEILKVNPDLAKIVTSYLKVDYSDQKIREMTEYAAIIYTIPAKHISENSIVTVIPRMYIKSKVAGDKIMVTDVNGKQYDFKLEEDRKTNMEKIATCYPSLSQELIACGFDGSHAQMERFMANSRYFSSHCNAIAQIRKKDATQVDASPLRADFDKDDLNCWNGNIDWVINGSKKKKKLI